MKYLRLNLVKKLIRPTWKELQHFVERFKKVSQMESDTMFLLKEYFKMSVTSQWNVMH